MVLTQQKVPLKIYQLSSKEAGQGGGAGVGVTMGTWVPLSPGPPGHTLPLPTVVTKSQSLTHSSTQLGVDWRWGWDWV